MDVILDCYEKIAAKYPKPDPRFRIIHCQITSEDILDRFARNGVLADIQPLFIRADMEIAEELLGKERVSTSYAWKTMLDKGIHVSGSSDAPVESFDPILAIHCAVTSQNLDGQPAGGWLPQQKLTVQEAVALYTTGSAYTSYEETSRASYAPTIWRTSSSCPRTSSPSRRMRSSTPKLSKPTWEVSWYIPVDIPFPTHQNKTIQERRES